MPPADSPPPPTSSERLRLCFVIATFHTENAGTEGHLMRLLRGLDYEQFEPTLIVLQDSAWTARFHDPRIHLETLGFTSFGRPAGWNSVRRLAQILKRRRIQLVESHSPDAHMVTGLAASLARTPIAVTCRRDLPEHYTKKMLRLCRLSNRWFTRHLANSQAAAESTARAEGVDPARIDVIYNGVDLDAFDQPSSHSVAPAFVAAADAGPVVVLAANPRPVKNIGLLVRAAAEIAPRFADAKFAVLGDGEDLPALQQLAAQLGVVDRILWMGSVPDVRPYLRRATIGCLTSDSEGFSNAIVEYMAAGLPVVATRVGGAAEAIDEGVTGRLTPPGDVAALAERLAELLADPARCRAYGAAGRRRVEERFSFRQHVAAHRQYYRDLIGGAAAPLRSAKLPTTAAL